MFSTSEKNNLRFIFTEITIRIFGTFIMVIVNFIFLILFGIALLHMQQKEVNTSVVSLESQIRHLREMLKYAEQYQKNKIYDDHYKSSKETY